MKKKVALMTAIVGGIDQRKEIPEQTLIHETHFFTEENWGDVVTTDRIKALYFKTQGHYFTEADIIIWVDGKIQINAHDFVEQCVTALGDQDLAIMKHLWRKCVYEEVDHIENCIANGNEYLATRYAHRPIRQQVNHYKSKGYPENNGLNDCCIIARKNSDKMNLLFNRWWYDCKRDLFDQTAIQFLAWERGIKIQPIVFKPGSFTDIPHLVIK